jgi:hypothetical protein
MKKLFKYWKNRPQTRQGWIDLYVSYLKRIPERQYFPIFVLLSLYFVVPYSEFVVTALIPLYFIFEKQVRWICSKIPMPGWLRIGGSVIFFLVMIDDYLFYFALMALAAWSIKQVNKENLDAAIEISKLFGLSEVGIDFISNDVSEPWYKNGAAFNEVNVAPLLGGGEISRGYIPIAIFFLFLPRVICSFSWMAIISLILERKFSSNISGDSLAIEYSVYFSLKYFLKSNVSIFLISYKYVNFIILLIFLNIL